MYYDIENNNIKATISDLGATLIKFIDKKTGRDIVLGFDDEKKYPEANCYFGASVGRNANRIGNGEFELNGKKYKLTINDNMNQLHGGKSGFSFRVWKVVDKKNDSITFELFSKDGEEGFPGNLTAKVTYKLDNNNLIWSYSGESDQDTIFNMTNHSYFNLGDENIINHELKIHTGKYSPTDDYALTLNKVVDVDGTGYDFKDFSLMGDNLSKLPNGIDNNYVYEKMGDKIMAELKYDGLQLNVYSDLPDMHVYTSSVLEPCVGKNGKQYKKFSAVCLECQFYPNSINYETYIKPILKKGEIASHYIRYELISK